MGLHVKEKLLTILTLSNGRLERPPPAPEVAQEAVLVFPVFPVFPVARLVPVAPLVLTVLRVPVQVLLVPVVLAIRLDPTVRCRPKSVRKAPWGPGWGGIIYYPRAYRRS